MGIYATDLRELIIRPTLEHLKDWSPAAENLLMGTAAQESQLGFRFHTNEHHGLGMFRISAKTHLEIWDEFLIKDPELASSLRGLASQQQFLKTPHVELITNLSYATGVAWMIYRRHRADLPSAHCIDELATYWLRYYTNRNTTQMRKGYDTTIELEKFETNFRKLVLRENKKLAA